MDLQGFSTKVIHAGYAKADAHRALQMPIYSNAAFEFETAEAMEEAFLGRRPWKKKIRVNGATAQGVTDPCPSGSTGSCCC